MRMNFCGEDASRILDPHAIVDDTTTTSRSSSNTSATQSTHQHHQGSFPPPGVWTESSGAGAGAPPPPSLRCHVDNISDTTTNSQQQEQSSNIRCQYLNIDTTTTAQENKIAKTPSPLPPLSSYYRWVPGPEIQHCRSPPSWHCPVCLQQFSNVDTLSTHFHQFHLNPHHLSPDDRRKYHLSNFLVNKTEDVEVKTDFNGLYRCHECFNVFNSLINLKQHLLLHSQPPTMVVSKFSREDFEDVSPRKRSRKCYKENKCESPEDLCSPEKVNNNVNGQKRTRTRLKRTKFIEFYSDPSDEFNSDSDFDGGKNSFSKKRKRKSSENKSKRRTFSKASENGFSVKDDKKAFVDELDDNEFVKNTKGKQKRNNKKHSKLKDQSDSEQNNSQIISNGHLPEQIAPALRNTSSTPKIIRRGQKHEKKWRFKIVDHSKLHNIVQNIVNPPTDFLCLGCNQSFSSYSDLSQHKYLCTGPRRINYINDTNIDSKNLKVKQEIVNDNGEELYKYVTGSVTAIPETTFNNMHGKIADLKTEDAQTFSQNHLNEIGLVKLNFSGNWSVKDVWESGCWEPRDDQLTWQDYELSSEIFKHVQAHKQDVMAAADQSKVEESKTDVKNETTEIDNEEVHKLTEKLTTQIVGRKAPIITSNLIDRQMVTAISKIPWTEQGYFKQRIDANISSKRNKRVSLNGDSIRQSNITNLLELKQTGKSVKYMKQVERESLAKTKSEPDDEMMVEGTLSGEWELDHSYMCSVCGVEYDDMLEILHHKWESHPHCLVSHCNVRDNVVKPPDLMYPQVGPSTVNRDEENNGEMAASITCSKCNSEFNDVEPDKFHLHLLECGGVADLMETGKKKKKKRGMGGGLKSTVRMLKQSVSQDGNGTDTEQSPKKKVKSAPKVVQPVPLIPTHKRTTRYKETMKKEAKKIAARERRVSKKRRRSLEVESEHQRQVIADVIDKLLDDVEKFRRKTSRGRCRSVTTSPKMEVKPNNVFNNSKNKRDVKIKTFKDQSDAEQKNTIVFNGHLPSSSKREVKPSKDISNSRNRRDIKVKTYKEDSSDNEDTSKEESPQTKESTISVSEAGLKIVKVLVFNDDDLARLTDLDKVITIKSSSDVVQSPPQPRVTTDSPRLLKRLASTLVVDTELNMSEETENVGGGKHSSRQQYSLEFKMTAISEMEEGVSQEEVAENLKISVSTLSAWWIRRSDIKTKYVNKLANGYHDELKEDSPVKNARHRSRSTDARQETTKTKLNGVKAILDGNSPLRVAKEKGVNPSQIDHWWKRKDNIIKRNKRLSLNDQEAKASSEFKKSKKVYSLEFKKRVIYRINAGEDIPAVAKQLKIRENTISVWWIRREQIINRALVTDTELEVIKNEEEIDPVEYNNKIEDQPNLSRSVDVTESDTDHIGKEQPRSRRSVSSARPSAPILTSRWCMPLEVKQTVIKRLEEGATQASVAKDLDVSLSTVASWWRKKESILGSAKNLTNSDADSPGLNEHELNTTTPHMNYQIDDLGVSELEKLMTDDLTENHLDTVANTRESISDNQTIKPYDSKNEINKDSENIAEKTGKEIEHITEKQLVSEALIQADSSSKIEDRNDDSFSSIGNENDVDLDMPVEGQLEADAPVPSNDVRENNVSELNSDTINIDIEGNDYGKMSEKNGDDDNVSLVLEDVCKETPSRPQSVISVSSTTTPRPQSGLQMIVSNYCSSDEEL